MQLPYFTLIALAIITPAFAVNPGEMLKDPLIESRAREISKGLRCVVCQNQSIDDSDAPLARDLRIIVRERLVAGDSDQEVISYVVSRYGDFVLLRPPFRSATFILWMGPFIFVFLGLLAFYAFFRRLDSTSPRSKATKPLSHEERNRLNELLEKDGS